MTAEAAASNTCGEGFAPNCKIITNNIAPLVIFASHQFDLRLVRCVCSLTNDVKFKARSVKSFHRGLFKSLLHLRVSVALRQSDSSEWFFFVIFSSCIIWLTVAHYRTRVDDAERNHMKLH